jgi:hypothetical protein
MAYPENCKRIPVHELTVVEIRIVPVMLKGTSGRHKDTKRRVVTPLTIESIQQYKEAPARTVEVEHNGKSGRILNIEDDGTVIVDFTREHLIL